jgi:hypothetical protein
VGCAAQRGAAILQRIFQGVSLENVRMVKYFMHYDCTKAKKLDLSQTWSQSWWVKKAFPQYTS